MMGDRATASSAAMVVALSAWLGASVLAAAVVAPAAFGVLPTRTLAGALVGRVLPVLFYGGAAVGIAVALLARTVLPSVATLVAGVLMLVTCLAAQLGVSPRIERIRADAGRPIDELTPGDPRRAAFGRLHGVSVLLLGMAGLAGGAALVLTLRTGALPHTSRDLPNSPLEH
jgi:hypothetical protein